MNDDKIEQLLQTADKTAGRPVYHTDNLTDIVRRRAHRRQIKRVVSSIAVIILIFAGLFLWTITNNNKQKPLSPEQIASLNDQIRDLNKRIDATVNLVREVLAQEKTQQRLDELEAKLASIPDPIDELNRKIEKTAIILVYYADKRYEESGDSQDLIQTYNRVIELFPQTRSAKLAKQKLTEIQNNPVNKNNI
jgi:hypothetical protein